MSWRALVVDTTIPTLLEGEVVKTDMRRISIRYLSRGVVSRKSIYMQYLGCIKVYRCGPITLHFAITSSWSDPLVPTNSNSVCRPLHTQLSTSSIGSLPETSYMV